ncbi:hypothetical protein ACFL2G_01600 [Candidatus Omnitrophota bacterium]
MKKLCILYSLLITAIFAGNSGVIFAATVGNSMDLDLPKTSAVLRQQVIDQTLNECEQKVKIKSALDLEFLFDKDLESSAEIGKAELKGQWYMAKLAVTVFDKVEPYVKIGTSNLEVKWKLNEGENIEVDADQGLAWGFGLKGVIWDFDEWGVRLTGDTQYRVTEPSDIESIMFRGDSISDPGADFKVEEWQLSLALSKKFELPLKMQSFYIVPYTGLTICDSLVDVKFRDPGYLAEQYSIYDANNKSNVGFFLGCDIMPTLTSSFIYSMELRLIDETSLTLGGAMKF